MKQVEKPYLPIDSMSMFFSNLESFQNRTCFRYYKNATQIEDMTYSQFAELGKSIAAGLTSLGLAQKRIAILGETSPYWVASYMAIIASGGVAVPLDKELQMEELEALLETAQVEGIVYSKKFETKLKHARESHATLQFFIPMTPPDEILDKELPLQQIIEQGKTNAKYTFPGLDSNRTAEMLFTSGTTGTSKCVLLSEKNILSSVVSAFRTVNFSKDDTIVSVLPIHHTYELCVLQAGMNLGMTICINDSLKHVLKNFKLFRPTGLVLVPLIINTMYKKIFDEIQKQNKTWKVKFALKLSRFLRFFHIDIRTKLFHEIKDIFGGRLEKIISGGAPLNPNVCDVFYEFGIQISEGYGITECSPLIAVNPYLRPKKGSVGPTVPSCKARIILNDVEQKTGETGEIVVKGDNVMLGYYNNPTANESAFTKDGWFRTGDMGYMDRDGYLFITGRYKSVIVLDSGKNVFPEEMEEQLSSLHGLLESVVVGRKETGTDRILLTAILVPDFTLVDEKLTDLELHDYFEKQVEVLNKKLPTFKQIRQIEIRRTEFEKTTSKKIRRYLVR